MAIATAFDGFRQPGKCKFNWLKMSSIENGVQRYINQILIPE